MVEIAIVIGATLFVVNRARIGEAAARADAETLAEEVLEIRWLPKVN